MTTDRQQNKRNKILNMAAKLFTTSGMKKVTMDEIAWRANVSKVTIYKYFKNKDNLYVCVAEHMLANHTSELDSAFTQDIDTAGKMIDVTKVLSQFIISGERSVCTEISSFYEQAAAMLKNTNRKTKTIIITLIKEGKAKKIIKKHISDECIYHYINMGLSYFQNSDEYRAKILTDKKFSGEFMTFIWSNIFIDHSMFQ